MEVAFCQVDMLDRPFALDIDADLHVADGENGPLLTVAEVEVDLVGAGQPGLAEFSGREGEAPRIAIEVPPQQHPQASARCQEPAPQLLRDETLLARPLVVRQQRLGVVTDKRPALQPP